ncbi:MAG: RNA polymerase subunit sigma-24 [Acidimicrobiia bacterium]|nr:RNA polymerase subunit sigma-24 [Acidimicrobiia bacterium]
MRGPEDRIDALWKAHSAALRARLVNMLPDRQLAEEVLNDTYLVAWRRMDQLTDPPESGAARAWLFAIARLVGANAARSHRARDRLVQRLSRMDHRTPSIAGSDDVVDLRLALEALPTEDRRVLRLAAIGARGRDLAVALGLNQPAARKRLSRARARLADLTGRPVHDDGDGGDGR